MNTFSSERIRHKKAEAVYLWRVPRLLKKSAHAMTKLKQFISALSWRIRSLEKVFISLDY